MSLRPSECVDNFNVHPSGSPSQQLRSSQERDAREHDDDDAEGLDPFDSETGKIPAAPGDQERRQERRADSDAPAELHAALG